MPQVKVITTVLLVNDNGKETEIASDERIIENDQVSQSFLSLAMAQSQPPNLGVLPTPVIT
jgi:hypothetical protein